MTMNSAFSIVDAILEIIKNMPTVSTKSGSVQKWKIVRKGPFFKILESNLADVKRIDERLSIDEFKARLNLPQQIGTEYPVAVRHGNDIYALIPFDKLEAYAESGRINMTRYRSCGLLTMTFI